MIQAWPTVRPEFSLWVGGDAMADVIMVSFLAGPTFGGWRTGLVHRLAGLAFMAIALVLGVTVQLLRATSVPLVLGILGPLLPQYIKSLVPGGVPGMPGLPFPHH